MARWFKRSDTWCVLVGEEHKPGETIDVQRADGTVSQVTLERVAGSNKLGTLWLPKSTPRKKTSGSSPAYGRKKKGWRPCGYPGCSPEYCDECDGEGG